MSKQVQCCHTRIKSESWGEWIHCPDCHTEFVSKDELTELQEQLEVEREDNANGKQAYSDLREQLEDAKRKHGSAMDALQHQKEHMDILREELATAKETIAAWKAHNRMTRPAADEDPPWEKRRKGYDG